MSRALCLKLSTDTIYKFCVRSKYIRDGRWDVIYAGINRSPYAYRVGRQVGNHPRDMHLSFIGRWFKCEFGLHRSVHYDEMLIEYTVNFQKQTITSKTLQESLF